LRVLGVIDSVNLLKPTTIARPVHTASVNDAFIDDDILAMKSACKDDHGAQATHVLNDFLDIGAVLGFDWGWCENRDFDATFEHFRESWLNLWPTIFTEEWRQTE